MGNPAQGAQHGQDRWKKIQNARASGSINKPRKETQATKTGGQNEDERSVVRFSCEGYGQCIETYRADSCTSDSQLAVHVVNHASWGTLKVIAWEIQEDIAASWEFPSNSVALSKRVPSLERRNSGCQVTSWGTLAAGIRSPAERGR